MRKRLFWALLALLAVAAIVLSIALPKRAGASREPAQSQALAQNAGTGAGEDLPLNQASQDSAASQPDLPAQTELDAEPSPNIDPGTGMELEENELPIVTP